MGHRSHVTRSNVTRSHVTRSRVTGHSSQVTVHRSQVTRSWVAGHRLPGHRSRVTGHRSRFTAHRSRVTDHRGTGAQVTNRGHPVMRSSLLALVRHTSRKGLAFWAISSQFFFILFTLYINSFILLLRGKDLAVSHSARKIFPFFNFDFS